MIMMNSKIVLDGIASTKATEASTAATEASTAASESATAAGNASTHAAGRAALESEVTKLLKICLHL